MVLLLGCYWGCNSWVQQLDELLAFSSEAMGRIHARCKNFAPLCTLKIIFFVIFALYIGNDYSCFVLNPFLEWECKKNPWRRKQTCWLVTCQTIHNIWFQEFRKRGAYLYYHLKWLCASFQAIDIVLCFLSQWPLKDRDDIQLRRVSHLMIHYKWLL